MNPGAPELGSGGVGVAFKDAGSDGGGGEGAGAPAEERARGCGEHAVQQVGPDLGPRPVQDVGAGVLLATGVRPVAAEHQAATGSAFEQGREDRLGLTGRGAVVPGDLDPYVLPSRQPQYGPSGVGCSARQAAVDSSPFSAGGAPAVADTEEHQRDKTFRGLLAWGMSMVIAAPLLAWLAFVVL